MQIIHLTAPVTVSPGDIIEPTKYIVDSDLADAFAVTIEGNWRVGNDDRFDDGFPWPPIIVECGYKSRGVLVLRCDNADFDAIRVTESRGRAVELRGVRQSDFRSIRAHRCQSDDSIIRFSGVEGSFSSNMINIGQIGCMGCDSPVTVEMINAAKNAVRIITIAQLDCHIAWETMQTQFPATASFGPRVRTHLALNDAAAVTILSVNFRMHKDDPEEARAVTAGENSADCVIIGGQILQKRGKTDLWKLVSGPVIVFPHR